MIIDITWEFATEQERAQIDNYLTLGGELLNEIAAISSEYTRAEIFFQDEKLSKALHDNLLKKREEIEKLDITSSELLHDLKERYVKAVSNDRGLILQHVSRIVNAIEKQDYIDRQMQIAAALKPLLDTPPDENAAEKEKKAYTYYAKEAEESWENCYRFILGAIKIQINILTDTAPLSVYQEAIDIVRNKADSFYTHKSGEEIDEPPEQKEQLQSTEKMEMQHFFTVNAYKVEFPLDKINSEIWKFIDPKPKVTIDFLTNKASSEKEAIVTYSIDFAALSDDLKITKQLTEYDKLCYMIVSALYNAGNKTISAGQIYTAMGGNSRPNKKDLKKINDSLTKMGTARIYIDNAQEVEVNKGYPIFRYDGDLLPFDRISAFINNSLCNSAIRLYREPPLITFAKERKQITTVGIELFSPPINKTEDNIAIVNYLIERISRMDKKGKNKILYSTIFTHCAITSIKQKQRAKSKITTCLEHYKAHGFIQDYGILQDGVKIMLYQ